MNSFANKPQDVTQIGRFIRIRVILLTLGVDFTSPNSFHPVGDPSAPGLWISFAPIWLFSTFLEYLSTRTLNAWLVYVALLLVLPPLSLPSALLLVLLTVNSLLV